MRFVSWNVNGLRAVVKKGFVDIFDQFNADIFAVQETKLQEGQIELDLPGYQQYWSYAERKGYSGTAVFSRVPVLSEVHELGIPELDTEGRIVALELEKIWFVNVYTPNAQAELARIDHRMAWDAAFRDFCVGLERGQLHGGTCAAKPVVICGDFNVAHQEIDLKNPDRNRGNAGFSDQERQSFSQLLEVGFIDTFRALHPDLTDAYTWWSYRFRARATNAGWRIDYFLISEALRSSLEGASIWSEVLGSDHCPVSIELE